MGAVAKFIPRYKVENADLGLIGWGKLPAASADWVNALRKRAHTDVQEMGIPTPKLERWKYTNLPAKLKKMELEHQPCEFELSGNTDHASAFPKGMLNIPDWAKEMLECDAPTQDKYGDMALWSAANAFLSDGFIVDVPKGAKSKTALHLQTSGQDGQFSVQRQIIRVAEGAEFTIIEDQRGSGAHWHNIVTQIQVAKGARLHHYRFQNNSDDSVITHNTYIEVEEGGNYEAFTMTTGAGMSRNQIQADLLGEEVVCRLNGVNLLDGTELADTTITVDHQAPNCNSYQDYRSVVADKAVGVFQGKIHVHQIAQKTDGYQMAKSLLLSPQATMNTKPELEIYADDVKCSHGATAGQLDEDALFYLRARGIPEKQAKNLLIQAFLNEVIEKVTDEKVRAQAANIVSEWLG